MGFFKAAYGRKDGDVFHEGDFYIHSTFGAIVNFTKQVNKELKTLSSKVGIHVVEVEENADSFKSKVQLNGKNDYRTIFIKDEPENARCYIKITFEMNDSSKATQFYDLFKASFEKHCPKVERQKELSQIIVNQSVSPVEEIKKYKELLDSGIITPEEFEKKKKELLNL